MSLLRAFRATSVARRYLHSSPYTPKIYNNILETIGNTPVVKLNNVGPADKHLYVKCEYFNPLSSVKDRLAIAVIEDAEKRGALKPGMTVVEATSGNTGIAVAMVCAQKGYPCVITMSESFSVERRKIMRALGAKVVLTPAGEKGTGMVRKAEELAEAHGWFLCRQFENEANPAYHANTTAPEILRDFAGLPLDYWVTGYGTGGTFAGTGKVLKAARPDVKVVLSEPEIAPLLKSGIPTERKPSGAPVASHPSFTPHPIQGWTPDFIPKIAEEGWASGVVDELVHVSAEESMAAAHALATKEGIFTGISGGATLATTLKLCEQIPAGSTVLTMLPDTAERYMSTPLFAAIQADMDDSEQEISQSTPFGHLPQGTC